MSTSQHSTNQRAEEIMGRRLTPELEKQGVVPFDCPCELGYWCPACKIEWDESLQWSEYTSFLWCPRCNFDWPSALCIRIDASPDPERDWINAGREAAVRVFLDSVQKAVARADRAEAERDDAAAAYRRYEAEIAAQLSRARVDLDTAQRECERMRAALRLILTVWDTEKIRVVGIEHPRPIPGVRLGDAIEKARAALSPAQPAAETEPKT